VHGLVDMFFCFASILSLFRYLFVGTPQQQLSDISLRQLTEVDIRCISGTTPELDFIEFLLAKALPVHL
jgi:hypothetical protein